MTELKAVIFDMDGVIIDSEPIHHKLSKELYRELQLEISDEEYNNYIGVSNKDHWLSLKDKYGLTESVEELLAIQVDRNISHFKKTELEPIAGVRELLVEIQDTGLETALASSSPLPYINTVIEKFSINKFFSVIISGENMERGKPHPDIFLETAGQLKVNPADCVVIEDSRNGVNAAKKAGMKCIGYLNPNSGNQDLSKADIIVDSLEKLNINKLKGLFV